MSVLNKTMKKEIEKRGLNSRIIFRILTEKLNVEIGERSFYLYIKQDLKNTEREQELRDSINLILKGYDKFLDKLTLS